MCPHNFSEAALPSEYVAFCGVSAVTRQILPAHHLASVVLFVSSGSELVALSQKEGSSAQLDCLSEEVYVLLNLDGGRRGEEVKGKCRH